MKNSKEIVVQSLSILFISLLFSCGGSGEEGGEAPKEQTNLPAKAIGVLPSNGEPCSDYEEIIDNDTRALIAFEWNASEFAESYEVVVFENGSEVVRKEVTALSTKIELDKGKTYTWLVVSFNDFGDVSSNTYSFTSPGIPVGNFAPYAAEINIEFDIGLKEMTITWIGNDEDKDDLIYDARIYESEELVHESLGVTDTFLQPTPYISETDYKIEVVSKDGSGNYSISTLSFLAPE